jgi:hypothetical protein
LIFGQTHPSLSNLGGNEEWMCLAFLRSRTGTDVMVFKNISPKKSVKTLVLEKNAFFPSKMGEICDQNIDPRCEREGNCSPLEVKVLP